MLDAPSSRLEHASGCAERCFGKLSLFVFPVLRLLTGCVYLWMSASFVHAETFAITDVNVVDVLEGRIRSNQTVLISNGIMAAIGPSGSIQVPPTATRIVGESRYLIPGLWDMHVHLRSDEKHRDRP